MPPFKIHSPFSPQGDQPLAIERLTAGLAAGLPHQVLLGVTGSGKTFTMANVVERAQRPALVLTHNKVLAAQLYREFKDLFPENAIEFFVSYYDYYQPEAYIPASDTYIEKDSSINEELDKLRLSATRSLIERRDVIIVASVSCIYGIGSPHEYRKFVTFLERGHKIDREELLRQLVAGQHKRADMDFHRGTFRARGDVIDIYPAYEDRSAIRVELFGDEVDAIWEIDPLTGKRKRGLQRAAIFPTSHYVTSAPRMEEALRAIAAEMEERVAELESANKLVEAQRLRGRTKYDMEIMREMGACPGIENYSRHLDGRKEGEPPNTLLHFFPDDYLLFIDESHVSIPQVRAMYNGDRARKTVLVEHGFRLPSALDNRPLKFEEFQGRMGQTIYVSATPAEWELEQAQGVVVEQVIRPTGLMDPKIEVRPASNQVEDLMGEIQEAVEKGERVLVTTLTKRMAEDLSEYYLELGIKCKYMHSDIDTIQRTEMIRDLRLGKFDVLIGINLLREGLDLPEVCLVAVLDADKEGFLRSRTSLIQTAGRAARNVEGRVILYGDKITDSMRATIDVTEHRRETQAAYNEEHGITPTTIKKEIQNILDTVYEADYASPLPLLPGEAALMAADGGVPGYGDEGWGCGASDNSNDNAGSEINKSIKSVAKGKTGKKIAAAPMAVAESGAGYSVSPREARRRIELLRRQMKEAAAALDFERAAALRDKLLFLEKRMLETEE